MLGLWAGWDVFYDRFDFLSLRQRNKYMRCMHGNTPRTFKDHGVVQIHGFQTERGWQKSGMGGLIVGRDAATQRCQIRTAEQGDAKTVLVKSENLQLHLRHAKTDELAARWVIRYC